jgi:phosphoribosyl 1,2-cyclic phosphate phosphodiesterase
MDITLLGTGDAIGTPKVGCSCPRCSFATETGIMRLRTSLLIRHNGHHILIDSSPDLRQQLLGHGSPLIDAVIWTHGHYDHFMGYGEFYRIQKLPPVYAAPPVIAYCGDIFKFMSFSRNPVRPYVPISLFGLSITLIEVNHPPVYSCGLVISNGKYRVGYTGDTNINIPDMGKKALEGVDLLFTDALAPEKFHISKHMNYQDACRLAGELQVRDFRCVHMSHAMDWDLPGTGHDGERFTFPE